MIRVLIAEDELLVRMGILSILNWEGMGMKVVSCVGDGLNALADARRYRPDLVITDIVMPGMDGIELLRTLRREKISPVSIVITALHQQQAEDQAKELGIAACLVKATMTRRDVLAAVQSARELLGGEDGESETENGAEDLIYEALLAGERPDCPPRPAGAYVLCSVREGGTLSDTLGQALSRLMQALFCESGRAVFAVRGGRILLALEKPAVLPRTEAVHSLWELRRYAERNLAVTPNFAVLSPAPAGADPGRCLQALIVETGEDSAGVCWLGELPPAQASLSREERVSFARQNAARLWALNSPKKIYAAWRTLERLADASAGQEQEEALDALAGALGIWRGAGLRGAYEACREALCTLAPDDSDRHEMGQVVALVLKNLHREVKLSEAAGKVGFHEVYFSALFKQQMGMGFARFCVQMRMEHAKRLLKERSISTCQVAEMCGYRDMAYFYRVFKQNVGVTPTAWRDAP